MKEIIERILKVLNSDAFYKEYDLHNKSYKYITETIKTLLAKEGKLLGYESCAHRNLLIEDYPFDEGEWMFDFIWYKMSKTDDHVMKSIPLVLESELSDKKWGGLKVDFDKLLVASSSNKVFVTSYDNKKIDELIKKEEYIQKAINGFESFSYTETLYLIIWDECDTAKFSLKEFRKH
jgi:hypothetical protein